MQKLQDDVEELEAEIQSQGIQDPNEWQDKLSKLEKKKSQIKVIESAFNKKKFFKRGTRDYKSQEELARTAVQRAIKRALDRIKVKIPRLYKYLNPNTIKTGDVCYYYLDSNEFINWKLHPEKRDN